MISVLVADDSALVRRLVSRALDGAGDITVVGVARDGADALAKIGLLRPDLLTLDIEMPVMDGLTAMREIHRRFPRLPVIMVSTLTQRGAAITLDALTAGARDYVTKPTNSASLANSLDELRDQLVPRIRALTTHRAVPATRSSAGGPAASASGGAAGRRACGPAMSVAAHGAAQPPSARPGRPNPERPAQLVAIGSSTGGPDALAQVLGSLTERPAVPMVAVQHMPPVFTTMLAQRLDRVGPATVVEAADRMPLVAGTVYLAPGGRHFEVRRQGGEVVVRLTDAAPVNYSKPSVDVLFASVAQAYPDSAIAVILTGMGHDGRAGCEQMGSGGGLVVAQDQASSVVWGMPGAVAEAGLADVTLPLAQIGPFLSEQLRRARGGQPAIAGVIGCP